MQIKQVSAREIVDSRGNPTVEADVVLADGSFGRAAVPSGASTGTHEALEMRDGDKSRYGGKGVQKAVQNVDNRIASEITGKAFASQTELDELLLKLDGTENKSQLGANAILAVSLAFAWASARSNGQQLFEYIGGLYGNSEFLSPRPMMNIMNGGAHANWTTDIQEYMVVPLQENSWSERLRISSEIFHTLEKLLAKKELSTNVGNEGGFAPHLRSNEEALELIVEAVESGGYRLGEEIGLALDIAASEFFNSETRQYELQRDGRTLSTEEMIEFVVGLTKKYPFVSLEDMLAEDDWDGWQRFTAHMGNTLQIVGDDLLVTNPERIQKAIETKACNSLLVKMNQIGTLSETLEAMRVSESAGWTNVVSHRSGETEDVTLAHLVVGTGAGQIKCGAPSRGERTAKYNELLRIEETIHSSR